MLLLSFPFKNISEPISFLEHPETWHGRIVETKFNEIVNLSRIYVTFYGGEVKSILFYSP